MRKGILIVSIMAAGFASGVLAADEDKKGHGAGGVRTEHASEQGLEKGKAWAGSREKGEPGQMDEKEKPGKQEKVKEQETEQKQEKKEKKDKKEKQEKTKKQDKSKAGKDK